MFGYLPAPFGVYAFGQVPDELDQSSPAPFKKLLEDPNAQFIYLIELYPYNAELQNKMTGVMPFGAAPYGVQEMTYKGGLTRVFLSDVGYVTKPTDTLPNRYFAGLVDNPLQFETGILSGDIFGTGNQSFGAISIHNGNGDMDHLSAYGWAGRRVVVKAGTRGFAYADFSIVFDGSVNDLEANDDMITLTIKDNSSKTDQPLLPPTYTGTGGLEGSEDLANKPKPLAYGVVKNIEPVLVDAANLIYQVHDGSILAVDVVRDSGVMLTNMGDVADITTATVGAGQFKTQLSGGYIKLGSTPAGRVTADVKGENKGAYVVSAAEIIQRILKTRLGAASLSDNDIDEGAFNALDSVLTGNFGIFITDTTTASSVIDQLLNPAGAYWTFNRQGQITAGVIDKIGTEKGQITAGVIDQEGVSRRDIHPAYRISVGYSPVWVVQKEDELAGATTQEDRTFLSTEYRYVTQQNEVLRAQDKHASELVFNTNISDKADAETLLARLVELYSQKRSVYTLTIHRSMFRYDLGDTVKLVYDRYGLNNGKNLLVVNIMEDAESGQVTMELWG